MDENFFSTFCPDCHRFSLENGHTCMNPNCESETLKIQEEPEPRCQGISVRCTPDKCYCLGEEE